MANIIPPRVSFVPTKREERPPGSSSVNGTVARHNFTRKAIPPPDDPSVSTSEINSSNSDYGGWQTSILQGSLGVAGFVVFVVVVLAMWRLVGNPKQMMRKAVGLRKKKNVRPETIENFLQLYHTMPEDGKEEPQTPCNTPVGPLASSSSQTDYCMLWMPAPPHMQANSAASPVLAFDGGYVANMAYRGQSFNSPDTSPELPEPVVPKEIPSRTDVDKIERVAVKAKQSQAVVASARSRQDEGHHPEQVLPRQNPSRTSSDKVEPVASKARQSHPVVAAGTSQQDESQNEGNSKQEKVITTTEVKISPKVPETDAADNGPTKATLSGVQASLESDNETPVDAKGQPQDVKGIPVDDQVVVLPSTSKEQLETKKTNSPKTPAHDPRAEQVVSEITVPLEQIFIESKQKMENPKEDTEDESEAMKTSCLPQESAKVLVAPPYCSSGESGDTPGSTAEKACQTPEAKQPKNLRKEDAKHSMVSNRSGPEPGIGNKLSAKTNDSTDDSTLAPLPPDKSHLKEHVTPTEEADAAPPLPPRQILAAPPTSTTQVAEAPRGIVPEEDNKVKGKLEKRSDLRLGEVDSPESAGLQSRRLIEKKHPEFEFSSTIL